MPKIDRPPSSTPGRHARPDPSTLIDLAISLRDKEKLKATFHQNRAPQVAPQRPGDKFKEVTLTDLSRSLNVPLKDVLSATSTATSSATTLRLLQLALLTVKPSETGTYRNDRQILKKVVADPLNRLKFEARQSTAWLTKFQNEAMAHQPFSPKWLQIAGEAQKRLNSELATAINSGHIKPQEIANPYLNFSLASVEKENVALRSEKAWQFSSTLGQPPRP